MGSVSWLERTAEVLVGDNDGVARVDAAVIKNTAAPKLELADAVLQFATSSVTPVVVKNYAIDSARYLAIRALVTGIDATGANVCEFVIEAGFKNVGGTVSEHHKTITEKGAASGVALDFTIVTGGVDLEATPLASAMTFQLHDLTHLAIP